MKGTKNTYRIGGMVDNDIIDIQDSYRQLLQSRGNEDKISMIDDLLPADPATFFSIGDVAIERAKKAYAFMKQSIKQENNHLIPREGVRLGIPNPAPEKVICVGKNYRDHAKEMDSDVPEIPVLFGKFNNALIGPEDVIEKSSYTNKLDYEVELGVVIGRKAKYVKRRQAYEYIAGYTIGNDISARDLQKRTSQWLQGKNLDRSTPIGPWIVTKDEIPHPDQLSVYAFVNGEKRQASHTSQLIFDIPYLIEFISHMITLKPGDIVLTGTPDGVGFAMNPPQFLRSGDIVTLEIEKIGKLENKVGNAS